MSEEAIFSEVDEELRRERMRNLWRRFAPYVFGAAAVIILLVAANEGWSWYQKSASATASDKFYSAAEMAEKGEIVPAQEALDAVVAETGGGYPLLAKFRQAALLAEDGKADEAIAAYDALSTDTPNGNARQLALVLAAFVLADKGDVAGVHSRIEGIITPQNPMRGLAREALGLAQYSAGDKDGARATFEEAMADPQGNSDRSGRMQLYVSQLIAEGAADPHPVADEANTTPDAAPAEAPEAAAAPATN